MKKKKFKRIFFSVSSSTFFCLPILHQTTTTTYDTDTENRNRNKRISVLCCWSALSDTFNFSFGRSSFCAHHQPKRNQKKIGGEGEKVFVEMACRKLSKKFNCKNDKLKVKLFIDNLCPIWLSKMVFVQQKKINFFFIQEKKYGSENNNNNINIYIRVCIINNKLIKFYFKCFIV